MFEKYLTPTGRLSSTQPQDIKDQWYISKFHDVHGTRYDYSSVSYDGTHAKVQIICKEHGIFYQSPANHLTGIGCPSCQGLKKKNTKECIMDFRQKHGDTYDYSKVSYVNSYTKVQIICKIHGVFLQTPNNHLNGHNCPSCQQLADTIYLLYCNDTFLTKIGITNNIDRRIKQLRGNFTLVQAFKVPDPRKLELILHKKYKSFNEYNSNVPTGNTEFFNLTELQIEEITQLITTQQDTILL